jgi:outer membrane autotransporter protein
VVGGNLYVTMNRPSSFAAAADTNNNRSLAAALDADAAAAVTGAHARLINQLLFTNFATFNDSLHLLSPAVYLAAGDACDRTTQYMAESISEYLRNRRAGQCNLVGSQTAAAFDAQADIARAVGSPSELAGIVKYCGGERTAVEQPENCDPTRSVWVNPFGVFYGEQTGGDHLGFQSNVAGVQFGIDKQLDANFIAGIGGGYDQMHVDGGDRASAGTTNTFRVGPYATWYNDVCYLDSSLTGGFHSNAFGRQAAVNDEIYSANGNYQANDLSLYLGGGRNYHVGDYTLSP